MKDDNQFSGIVRVRVSALIIMDDAILLVKQKVPTREHPVWLPPGGGIDMGEYSEMTLKREVREETNLRINSLKLRYLHEFVEPPYHALELYYNVAEIEGELKKGFDPELDSDHQQIIDVKFISIYNINRLNLYPEFLKREIASNNVAQQGIKHFTNV